MDDLELSNSLELLKEVVKPVVESIRSLQLSSTVYITFLHYDPEADSFDLVDFVTPNPLYPSHKQISKEDGAFYFAYNAIDNLRTEGQQQYAIGCDITGPQCPWPDNIKSEAKEKGLFSVISMPVMLGEQNIVVGVVNTFYDEALRENTRKTDILIAKCYLIATAVHKLLENHMLDKLIIKGEEQNRRLLAAKEIQQGLLPEAPLNKGGFDIIGRCKQAYEIGGDFFHYFELPEGNLAFTVADACGKGLDATLIIMEYYGVFQSLISESQNLSDVANKINKVLFRITPSNMFVEAFLGIISLENNVLSFINAGQRHISFYKYDAKAFIDLESKSSGLLGASMKINFDSAVNSVEMVPGDMLVLMTDGLSECINEKGEEISKEEIMNLIRQNHLRSSEVVLDMLFEMEENFRQGSERKDDQTALIIRKSF